MKMGGQVRAIEGAVLGWDIGAALQMAHALGYDTLAVADLLPEVEEVACRKINERSAEVKRGHVVGGVGEAEGADEFGDFG
ncbi:hypothetical protein SAMN04490244_101264 [Tranquillimonas rosea]|uniref:Uncharacterized protein n=1 Tax=Tranquillimonas rosea TaxID=641238 RepID=A0A1H9PNB8_9RHOB|nr:hypothetical protein [Tranquillimonas rosea]SER49682.1 hypothetical protein SAMN04490244_101264 [Tranquillimonas rosea]